jgi:hypothetical protein
VFHRPVGAEYTPRIAVGRDLRSVPEGERQFSPNKAYYYVAQCADTSTPSPWDSLISVFNERPGYLQIVFTDHSQYNLSLEWINEKLIFLRVWWGRVLGTDVILDVERETIVYQEMVHGGTIPFQQYKQFKNK